MPRFVRQVPRLLLITEITLVVWILHNVAYETTYRLFLSHRVDDASRSSAAQRFDIEGSRVVPQIAMRPMTGADRVGFTSALGKRSTLHVGLRPEARARYEIRWRDGSASRVLAAGEAATVTSLAVPIPREAGVVELASNGPLTWVDPRLVRDLHIGPHALALTLLLSVSIALARRGRADSRAHTRDIPQL